ncbi:sensor histidine kinase [Bifidobacterium sp. ESL0728]|uniref:sensor histidine kinase n=1 Tax=Bifidobacterium sp. ESL0728 TaxID=2983220 RepID=UPI0023F64F6B|nr:sensor histidine kinase [Bifidobacterium sp. ESL0728]WEV58411.1 sensor histidine kinase [Bifidobacterium sp. ESL0728]
MSDRGKDKSTENPSRFSINRKAPRRRFPKYSALIFALAFAFIIPDSAYVGHFVLMVLQPVLILLLYTAMVKAPKLFWQRAAALILIAVCIWSAPYLRHGGQLLTYIVIAEASILFNATFGYVAIMLSAVAMWLLSPMLNPLSSSRLPDSIATSIYILFAGVLFMVYTVQSEKLQRANEQLQDNIQQIESLTLSRERARMASEMHDSIGQQLTAIHYAHESAANATALATGLTETERATINKSIAKSDEIAEGALSEVRQMARALDPAAFGQTLTNESIGAMARSFRQTGLEMQTDITGEVSLLGPDEQTLLFRALQETLTNAVRHAHATKVRLAIAVGGHETTLRVEDDGPGIGVDDIDHGFGLAALRQRMEQIGGSLTLGESQSLGGASITVTIAKPNKRKSTKPSQSSNSDTAKHISKESGENNATTPTKGTDKS